MKTNTICFVCILNSRFNRALIETRTFREENAQWSFVRDLLLHIQFRNKSDMEAVYCCWAPAKRRDPAKHGLRDNPK